MKITKITTIFISCKTELLANYRIYISVLSCIAKIIELFMCNRFYKYLAKNDVLFQNQFGIKEDHSTNQVVVELSSYLYDSFNQNKYTFVLFKVVWYCWSWYFSWISLQKKQYIQIGVVTTSNSEEVCGVSQGSILELLSFILYVNDIYKVSNIFEPVMFTVNMNVFFHAEMRWYFSLVTRC